MRKVKYLFFVFSYISCLFFAAGAIAADNLDTGVEKYLGKKQMGDFSALIKTRTIRALVPYSKTFYFLDGATQKGATYELLKEFEKYLNKKLKTKHLKVHVVIIPTTRGQLLEASQVGRGEIAAGNLTITKERQKQVDFSAPFAKNVKEIVVTGSAAPKIASLEDLGGKEVFVRKSSSYYGSLLSLNRKLKAAGKPVVEIVETSEFLEDEDLLEMVSAGLIPIIVMDDHKAKFWEKVQKNVTMHYDLVLNGGGEIGWAIRQNSPELKRVINQFVQKHKKGTLFGNIIIKRYLVDTSEVKNNVQASEMKRFRKTIDLFRKYGEQYSLDWLLLAAMAYQESTIDQSKRSQAGAVGVMQILPSTAGDKNVGIKEIDKIEPNIHAGTKYIRFMVDRYFDDPKIDALNKGLFAFASYNAGPAKVAKLRREAAQSGLNPDVWFGNVEVIAAKRIGRETVQYVSNIFKYYTAYLYVVRQNKMKKAVKEAYK